MQLIDGRLVFSASDLNGFLECAALTGLERKAAAGMTVRPEPDETTRLIARKGDEHERRYLDALLAGGVDVCEIRPAGHAGGQTLRDAESATLAAMERGVAIIYQGTFFDGTFMGHADFLRRVERPCAKWPWSYEVLDTKLALSTKTYFLVQLCNYSEHVARLQGTMPQRFVVIPGSNVETPGEVSEYLAYYHHLKAAFLAYMRSGTDGAYPHEVGHCRVCRWRTACEQRRDTDDYLGLVAWMRLDAIRRLENAGVRTIARLAAAGETQRPDGMKPETFARLRDQARLQHAQRTTGTYAYELLPLQPGRGFTLLPPPDEGDVFFDMEGDPLYTPDRGLEYLFGIYLAKEQRYIAYWARSDRDERAAFESLVDFIDARRASYPRMHVYHYAPYETTALKRLSGYHATREESLDVLLRAQTFVDLYAVVRQGMRISQPSYSIKKLEPFYHFTRDTKTQRGDDSILMFESWLVDGDDNVLVDIENYNRDDCISTQRLRDWLLELRRELAVRDGDFPWKPEPVPRETEGVPDDDEREHLRATLLAGLETPQSLQQLRDASEAFRTRWLLGHLLDYHRRDEKPAWWAYFYRCENQDELVEFDREALAGLRHRGDVAPYKLKPRDRNEVHVYEFPDQTHAFVEGANAHLLDPHHPRTAGTVVRFDEEGRQLHLKVAQNVDPESIAALVPLPVVGSKPLREALLQVARSYARGSFEEHRALADVLLRRLPRLRDRPHGSRLQPETIDVGELSALAEQLDQSFLFIQGPPGSGKSTLGAGIVLSLLRSGKRVAVLANAHKAVHNLLHIIEEKAHAAGQTFRGMQKYSESNEGSRYESATRDSLIEPVASNEAFAQPHDLAAGVAWSFCREDLAGAYDYLVIEEAGQVSLANAIACAPCARNIILLGDPLQLAQVSQGTHPPGVELSVLEHLLGEHTTVPPDRGVFLDRSHRLHPAICDFISESVYGGRLQPAKATSANRVESPGLRGSGLRFLGVEHIANERESVEEADRIAQEIALLCEGRVTIGSSGGAPSERRFTQHDALVVTPYNAQRRLIECLLRDAGLDGVRVGTVDKFQGQEAPVVFYSMTTSSGDDVPRDLAFLFEKNRFNVAVSRAQCMSVVLCSPRLLETRCSTPAQVALVNLLCRYVEAATVDPAPWRPPAQA